MPARTREDTITPEEFEAKMDEYKAKLAAMFAESKELEGEILTQLELIGND